MNVWTTNKQLTFENYFNFWLIEQKKKLKEGVMP